MIYMNDTTYKQSEALIKIQKVMMLIAFRSEL